MQTSAIKFLQAVIHFITGDAFEQGAKVSLSVSLYDFYPVCVSAVLHEMF